MNNIKSCKLTQNLTENFPLIISIDKITLMENNNEAIVKSVIPVQ